MTQQTIPLLGGPQAWRLIRTNRDAPSEAEVLDTLGPAMAYFLRPANDTESPWEIYRSAPDEYRIGAARPILAASAGREPQPLPEGTTLADRQGGVGDVIPTVRGARPWFVNVRLWWRGNPALLPYPALSVDWLGFRSRTLSGADWVLDEAVMMPATTEDPGAETWGEAKGERVASTAKAVVPKYGVPLALVAGAAAAAWLYLRKSGES